MKNDIDRILNLAVKAPSGDNSQPWRFEVTENVIYVFNNPAKDLSLYNHKQIANLVALGTLIENITVASCSLGYTNEVTLFPDKDDLNLIGKIALEKNLIPDSKISEVLSRRSSNRRPYDGRKIPEKILSKLRSVSKEEGQIQFFDDKIKINELAKILSLNEKILLENRNLHSTLFSHVTWNKKDDDKNHGFYIDTFEFNPIQKFLFKLLSNWQLSVFFSFFGISNLISFENQKIYRTSSAFGLIVMPTGDNKDYIKTGIILEKLWLLATELGLSIQPTTGVNFLMKRIMDGNFNDMHRGHIELIKTSYQKLLTVCNIKNGIITFVFRIGHAEPPSGRTTRFEPEVKYR
jgi:nitroreductase